MNLTKIKSQLKNIFYHRKVLAALVIFFLIIATSLILVKVNKSRVLASPVRYSILYDLVNSDRINLGKKPLRFNEKLYQAAFNKANDMLEQDYFEHYTPNGQSPWDFIRQAGYSYGIAGENLAMDFATSEGTHKAWMQSASHKENILRDDFEEVGIATVKGEFSGRQTTMVVQMFAKPYKNNYLWENWFKVINWISNR